MRNASLIPAGPSAPRTHRQQAEAGVAAPLRDPAVFRTARLSAYRDAVEWGDADGDLAIDAEHLRRIAEAQRPFRREELLAWQNSIGFSNQEAASFLGVALSTWNAYKAGAPIPVHVGMVCRAAVRDPVLVHAHHKPRVAGRPRKALESPEMTAARLRTGRASLSAGGSDPSADRTQAP